MCHLLLLLKDIPYAVKCANEFAEKHTYVIIILITLPLIKLRGSQRKLVF